MAKTISIAGLAFKQKQKIIHDFTNEVVIMMDLRSPRIVNIYGVITTNADSLCLVMEYCPRGDLRVFLDSGEAIDERHKLGMAYEIAAGMAYLYSRGVEHRDLKAKNCLLDEHGHIKLTDFGLAKNADLVTHTASKTSGGISGTIPHMAPEVLDDDDEDNAFGFTEKSDMYSFAITMFELLTCDYPWRKKTPAQIITLVCFRSKRPSYTQSSPVELVNIMERGWAQSPQDRPTFQEVVRELSHIEYGEESEADRPAAEEPPPPPQHDGDLATWLKEIGLERFIHTFYHDAGITSLDDLCELDEEGVTEVISICGLVAGFKRKFMKGLENIKPQPPPLPPPEPEPEPMPMIAPTLQTSNAALQS